MTNSTQRRLGLLLLLAFLACGMVAAQETGGASSSTQSAQTSTSSGANQAATAQQQTEQRDAAATAEAAKSAEHGTSEETEEEENPQFKYSPSERWFARHLGLNIHQMYWISLLINFALLALFFWVLLKAKLPQAFRDRKAGIKNSIKEAQAARADATRRLTEIEARLGKLDREVAEIRASAEKESAAEEERIRQAAEQDKLKVVQAAEAEIAAIARNARRELKGYAASLAVDQAARRIRVDDLTDRALVREFVDQLGKDGK